MQCVGRPDTDRGDPAGVRTLVSPNASRATAAPPADVYWAALAIQNLRLRLARAVALVGIDRPVLHTLLGRGWSLVAGPVTLLLITRFLSPEQQGYFYTFGSLAALNVFFELGLSYVLM